MASKIAAYLFILAIVLVFAAYFQGASGLFSAAVNAVNEVGRFFTGQTATTQPTAAAKAA